MEEIKVENNPLGFKVFATNAFYLEYMPKDQLDLFISSLTEQVLNVEQGQDSREELNKVS